MEPELPPSTQHPMAPGCVAFPFGNPRISPFKGQVPGECGCPAPHLWDNVLHWVWYSGKAVSCCLCKGLWDDRSLPGGASREDFSFILLSTPTRCSVNTAGCHLDGWFSPPSPEVGLRDFAWGRSRSKPRELLISSQRNGLHLQESVATFKPKDPLQNSQGGVT